MLTIKQAVLKTQGCGLRHDHFLQVPHGNSVVRRVEDASLRISMPAPFSNSRVVSLA